MNDWPCGSGGRADGWGRLGAAAPACEAVFLIFFAVELFLRLLVHRLYFFCNEDMTWNYFDFCIVALSALDGLSPAFASGASNVTFLRCARVLRLVRTIRVVRLRGRRGVSLVRGSWSLRAQIVQDTTCRADLQHGFRVGQIQANATDIDRSRSTSTHRESWPNQGHV